MSFLKARESGDMTELAKTTGALRELAKKGHACSADFWLCRTMPKVPMVPFVSKAHETAAIKYLLDKGAYIKTGLKLSNEQSQEIN